MNLKYFAIALIGLGVLGAGLWRSLPAGPGFIAEKKSKSIEIKKEESDGEKKIRTKFAGKSVDSIRANQILLLTKKIKIASR